MKMKKRTFRSKLYFVFVSSIIVPIIVIGSLFTIIYSHTIMKQEEKNISYILKSICNSMQVQFTEIKNIGDTYYMQEEVFQEIESLNNPKLYENYDELVMSRLETDYSTAIIKMLYMSKQEIKDVVFFPINSASGKGYYVDKNHSSLQVIDVPEYAESEWFLEALEADGQSVFYGNHKPSYGNNEEVYSCVRAIKDMDNKRTIGVIKIDADIRNLQNAIKVVDREEDDNITITEENRILTAIDETTTWKTELQTKGYQINAGRLYYVQSVTIPDTDWKLAYFFSMKPIFINYVVVLFLGIIVTIVAEFSAFGIYKRYTKETVEDMENITKILHRIQTGNLDVQVEVKSENELHDIAGAVNQMSHNLKTYIDKEYIWKIRQQKAEYQALQAQINPHFLYNTLNGFIALNRMGEVKKLEKSIINLTHLFRYICSSKDETSIQEECAFLRKYLELEKVKYEERLEYMVWVDKSCKDKAIPKLLLQPIVENSIVHGMGDTDDPILITIMAREVETKGIGKVIIINVKDNGTGFEKRKLNEEKEHIGIDNVRIRMEMFFEHAIYQCRTVLGKGTETIFVIKDEREEEE